MHSGSQQTAPETLRHAAGPFVTRVVQTLSGDLRLIFHSRRHRKGLPPVVLRGDGTRHRTGLRPHPWFHLWAPDRLAWWIACLFIVGSACFAMASFASNWPHAVPAALADAAAAGKVFFVGSIFFTSAAWLQWLESINGDVADIGRISAIERKKWRWFAWRPRNAGYLSSLIQFIGTLMFNLNTGDALFPGLTWLESDLLIWTPNMVGSVCFLASSYLALIEVSHTFWSWAPRQVDWWIVILNLLGSIAFQASALFSFFPPHPGAGGAAWTANTLTMTGALCFFVASYLMIPELFDAGGDAAAKAETRCVDPEHVPEHKER